MDLLVLLLPLLIAVSWARLFHPGHRLEGTTVLVVPLPLLARLRMHIVLIAASVILATTLALLDLMPWLGLLAPLISAVLLLAISVNYTLTTVGIRLGLKRFRRWTEFAAVRRSPGGARLIGVQRSRGLNIWLSGSRGDDEFLHFLRETVKNAYKGGRITSFPAPGPSTGHLTEGGPEVHIAAFSADSSGTRNLP